MPYISPDNRQNIDAAINNLLIQVEEYCNKFPYSTERSGLANYIITRILTNFLKTNGVWKYFKLSQLIGTLECAKLEIYRRLISKYEDKCIERNGDLKEFDET